MQASREFIEIVDNIYGVFLDVGNGFSRMLESIQNNQNRTCTERGISIEELDTRNVFYGSGPPNNSKSQIFHATTAGEYKIRIAKNGPNVTFVGNLCLVAIYQFWEDKYRAEIAAQLGITREDLKSDLFGDIRHIRRSIIHNKSIGLPELARCKKLVWFKPGDTIAMDEPKLTNLVHFVKEECSGFMRDA